jgi:hypothetical protein
VGFFKDIKKLNDQGKAIREQYPVKAQMEQAQAQMAQANQMMAAMAQGTVAATGAITNGVDAIATVTASRQTGASMNLNPVVELELLVMMPGGVPMPVKRQEMVQQLHLGRAQVGSRLKVKVDPVDASKLWIDWVTPP